MFLLLSAVRGVLERRHSPLVNRVFSSVPLGHLPFLLELCKLPPVVDRGEQLPDEQQCQTDQDYANDDTQNDRQYVHRLRTFSFVLGPHCVFAVGLQLVDECVLAVILIPKNTQLFTFFANFNVGGLDSEESAVCLALLFRKCSNLEHLAQDAILEGFAFARTSRTVLTIQAAVTFFIRLVALALPAEAFAEPTAYFPIGTDAGVVGVQAVAVGTGPAVATLALATDAASLFFSSAEVSVDPIARKVVALAILAGHDLFVFLPGMTLADSASAVPTAGAGLGVVREKASFFVLDLVGSLGVALTLSAVTVVVAAADSALEGSIASRALGTVWFLIPGHLTITLADHF